MKFFLFAAFALSLILAVSAQTESECNVREVQGCITAFAERVSKIPYTCSYNYYTFLHLK